MSSKRWEAVVVVSCYKVQVIASYHYLFAYKMENSSSSGCGICPRGGGGGGGGGGMRRIVSVGIEYLD